MNWIVITLSWYFPLLAIGLIFFPITRRFFHQFIDYGYPLAKTSGILLISYLTFILGITRLAPFTQTTLLIIMGLVLLVSFYCQKRWPTTNKQSHSWWILIIIEELLFIGSLFFLTFVRSQEPSIHGLEKFMDYGFINSILRSTHFPPQDIWLSADAQNPGGYPINYYYFGHLTGAVLIKLTQLSSAVGYNLILASIFAQAITITFSLAINLVGLLAKSIKKTVASIWSLVGYGLLGSFIVNLAGNLHTIYLFTTGYPPEKPIPFWQIPFGYNASKYWYPNATRFIPFTIHEFPSYSYVVADLHGHVFDIPFVLLTLSVLLILFINGLSRSKILNSTCPSKSEGRSGKFLILNSIFLGFLTALHYMTNAFDGPIYLFLSLAVFFLIYRMTTTFFIHTLILITGFFIFSLPFSLFFKPFVSGIGLNCSPQFLVNLKKLGPFLFERGNCQPDPLWMLFVLWGFFWVCFGLLIAVILRHKQSRPTQSINLYLLLLFAFGTFLVIIPEFFYIKDIYPAHYRANTMFKLGYQAFIMMGIAAIGVFFQLRQLRWWPGLLGRLVFLGVFIFIFIYPFHSFPAYYGNFTRPPQLSGDVWMLDNNPSDKEIIDYLNKNIKGQPVILEAQGDSYTDYNRISAYTGLPTVAGWWVHEWLWRGSANVVGFRIDDIVNIYQSDDVLQTQRLLKKYQVVYVIIAPLERSKYQKLNEDKFSKIGQPIFRSKKRDATIYKIN